MTTPICEFVKKYVSEKAVRLHMPGHKGRGFLGLEAIDITEVDGADVLYMSEGIIAESQQNAGALFGTGKTLYSTEGSSLCIRAMVYLMTLVAKESGKRPLIAAGRNAHKAFMSAVALADAQVDWLYSEKNDGVTGCEITPEGLDRYMSRASELPVAVYITSPDYLGNIADVRALSEVCRKYGVLLMVDNAHGAYLRFLSRDRHPISLGADICCDSAHKTLPVLTGGAYLHINAQTDKVLTENSERAMMLFASTSPSYITLQSLDIANAYMELGYRERLANIAAALRELKAALKEKGYTLVGDEPIKLTVGTKDYGYRGGDLANLLGKEGFVCEFCDDDYVVLMFTPEITRSELEGLKKCFLSIPKREPIIEQPPTAPVLERATSVRDAVFAATELIDIDRAEGRILAEASVSCPPAIPIVVCGEVISKEAIECMKYYGTKRLRVVK